MNKKITNFWVKIKNLCLKPKQIIFSDSNKKSLALTKLFLSAKIKYTIELLVLVLVYGLIVMLIDNQILGHKFGILRIFALGFIVYIIKLEVPMIISSCFPAKRI